MSKPYIHSINSAKRYGGVPEDYMDIHSLMDSTKGHIATPIHRIIFHSTFACQPGGILELIFGQTRVNSEGKTYSVRDIAEEHCLEDFGNRFIPTLQDYLQDIPIIDWLINGKGYPPSCKQIEQARKNKVLNKIKVD